MFRRARSLLLLASVVVLVVAAACGADPEPEPQAGRQATTGTLARALDPVLVPVAEIPQPIALVPHPDTGDLYVAEREGRVHLVDPETGAVGPQPLVDVSDEVSSSGERGLLGLAVDPDARHLYLSYTNRQGDTRIDEYALDGTAVVGGSRREVFALDQPYSNHNGGDITFGPDGYLYVGLGDGGSGGDPQGNGQDPSTLLGSLLRIDPSGDDADQAPDDNPFVDGGGAPEVWLYGVRNPWRFSFDRETGDLWIGDVGQDRIEEIDWLPNLGGEGAGRAANLGWGAMEGTESYEGGVEPDDHVPPVFEYASTGDDCAVTGGYVYRGTALPDLRGAYVYGDYCAGQVRYLVLEDGVVREQGDLGVSVPRDSLVSFGEDLDGEIYVLSIIEGTLYRIEGA